MKMEKLIMELEIWIMANKLCMERGSRLLCMHNIYYIELLNRICKGVVTFLENCVKLGCATRKQMYRIIFYLFSIYKIITTILTELLFTNK